MVFSKLFRKMASQWIQHCIQDVAWARAISILEKTQLNLKSCFSSLFWSNINSYLLFICKKTGLLWSLPQKKASFTLQYKCKFSSSIFSLIAKRVNMSRKSFCLSSLQSKVSFVRFSKELKQLRVKIQRTISFVKLERHKSSSVTFFLPSKSILEKLVKSSWFWFMYFSNPRLNKSIFIFVRFCMDGFRFPV